MKNVMVSRGRLGWNAGFMDDHGARPARRSARLLLRLVLSFDEREDDRDHRIHAPGEPRP